MYLSSRPPCLGFLALGTFIGGQVMLPNDLEKDILIISIFGVFLNIPFHILIRLQSPAFRLYKLQYQLHPPISERIGRLSGSIDIRCLIGLFQCGEIAYCDGNEIYNGIFSEGG